MAKEMNKERETVTLILATDLNITKTCAKTALRNVSSQQNIRTDTCSDLLTRLLTFCIKRRLAIRLQFSSVTQIQNTKLSSLNDQSL